mmetsp:Transcript_42254/g.107409  ORF Transcript_42254/g.107409 Transcript_42254/m.107409 type:complete len:248 (-) Transcript_42254:189-932(-)
MSFTMRSLIIFLTLEKGSSATRTARAESTRLFMRLPCAKRKSAARCCGCEEEARSCARDVPFCTSDGKCFSALPATAPLERISTAFAMASISSERSCWRISKSEAFWPQVPSRSVRYCESACMVEVVSEREPSASAFACSFFALLSDFSPRSVSDCSTCAVKSWMSMSKACLPFISSFSSWVRSSMNLSCNFSSISMTPCDWNSYPCASGAETSKPSGSSDESCIKNRSMAVLASCGMRLNDLREAT